VNDGSSPNTRRALGVVAAAIGAVLAWLIAEGVFDVAFGISVVGEDDPVAMSTAVIAIGALGVSLLSWLAAAILARLVPRPRATWIGLGLLVYVLWIIPILQTVDADARDRIAILLVHTVVLAVLMWAMAPTLPQQRSH